MQTYRILVVDNQEEWLESCYIINNLRKEFLMEDSVIEGAHSPPEKSPVEGSAIEDANASPKKTSLKGPIIEGAISSSEAKKKIDNSFYHAAFVDLHLDPTDNLTGVDILEYLAKNRPSCRRFLFTEKLQDALNAGDLQHMLQVRKPLIEGIVSKPDITKKGHRDEILALVKEYLNHTIDIRWPGEGELREEIVARQRERMPAKAEIMPTRDELNYLLSDLLGQKPEERYKSEGDVVWVALEPLTGGRSSAAVLKGKTALRSGTEGIWLVFKVDKKEKVESEVENFRHFVKWTLQTNRRVEMLSHVVGDTLGAVCYSFAHSSPSDVTSLEVIVEKRQQRAIPLVSQIFDQKLEWYSTLKEDTNGTAYYFDDVHSLQKPRFLLEEAAKEIAQELGDEMAKGDSARDYGIIASGIGNIEFKTHKGQRLLFPIDWLGRPDRSNPYLACVVHGDLNLGNIIVPDTSAGVDSWVFIDYAFTGVGPALMDFVVLHAHTLLTLHNDATPDNWLEMDRKLLQALHDGEGMNAPCENYCESLCRTIFTAMENTFAEGFQNYYKSEDWRSKFQSQFAITSMQWSIRLLRAKGLEISQRIRLLVWMTALRKCFKKLV